MKLAFSTCDVSRPSFLSLCEYAYDYGYAGFEIFDAPRERLEHTDSILRSDKRIDSHRKLVNRHLNVAALSMEKPINEETDPAEQLIRYINMAASAFVEYVIIRFSEIPEKEKLLSALEPAIRRAEKTGTGILLETSGPLSSTEKTLELLHWFSSISFGVAWDIRSTFFEGKESAQTTIRNLGAYIRYVRLGDQKDGINVLIGEGELPVNDFLMALHSLNYDGMICVLWNDEIRDADLVLVHFAQYLDSLTRIRKKSRALQENRSHTGTFPWKKYDVVDLTFSQVLDTMAELYPDQYAFKYTTLDYTRTYAEFRRDVDDTAAAFIALGVKPGYHVAVWATNIPQWFLAFWAAVKIGAVLVTVNTAYKIHEVEYLLRQSDTHTLIMIESARDANYKAIMQELCPELAYHDPTVPLYASRLPFLRNIVSVGFRMDGALTWEKMMERGSLVSHEEVRRRAAAVLPDDVCNMQYTSGTTGFPKGVMLTHSNIINNGKIIGDRMDLSTADRMMIQVPMFHCFGMVLSMTSTMTHGGTICPMPYYSPKSSLACITQEKITCFNGVPTMFIGMFNHPDFARTDFSHIRTGIMAGANCPPELMRRAAEEMNMKEIISVYGQTEASPGCTMGEVTESLEKRTETVGSPFPGVECRIIDPQTGKEVPDGENGEFVVRGYNVMKGYYKMPVETAETIDEDGWLHTGDLCCRTPDGYFKVTGRLKDMIIRGGENIYPREIEEFYLTHPKVRDVQVIGVADSRYGEEACAWIILHDGAEADEQEMLQYGIDHMARHKVPRYFFFTQEFPMNAAGKVLKYKMKEETEKRIAAKA